MDKRITIRLDDATIAKLETMSKKYGMSKAEVIRVVLENQLQKYANQPQMTTQQYNEFKQLFFDAKTELGKVETQLKKIGNNVNQLAKINRKNQNEKALNNERNYKLFRSYINELETLQTAIERLSASVNDFGGANSAR